jgi:hypothetical protein
MSASRQGREYRLDKGVRLRSDIHTMFDRGHSV